MLTNSQTAMTSHWRSKSFEFTSTVIEEAKHNHVNIALDSDKMRVEQGQKKSPKIKIEQYICEFRKIL